MGNESNEYATLGERLKLAREHAGLSQAQVATLIGLHRPSVSESEAGNRRVSTEELAMYSDIYKVDIEWLTRGNKAGTENDVRVQLAARALAKLKAKDLDRVLGLLQTLRHGERRP